MGISIDCPLVVIDCSTLPYFNGVEEDIYEQASVGLMPDITDSIQSTFFNFTVLVYPGHEFKDLSKYVKGDWKPRLDFYNPYLEIFEVGAGPYRVVLAGDFKNSSKYPRTSIVKLDNYLFSGKTYKIDFYLEEASWGSIPFKKLYLKSMCFETK